MNKLTHLFIGIFLSITFSCSESVKPTNPSENAAPTELSPETFLLYKNFPSAFTTPRNIEVWLPKQYAELDSVSVLYMFDGQNIFHGTRGWSGEYNAGWQVDDILDTLIQTNKIPPVMVVGIFNGQEKRGSEYMPEKPKELVKKRIEETTHDWYKHYKEIPPESDNHLRFIVEELKPFIDANFKTKSDRAHTYVGGSSMGSLISAYAICEYPKIFGGAACFSTHWPPLEGVFLEYIKENLPDPATHKIWFDHGTEELDAEYEPYQNIADEAMKARGYEYGKNWITKKFEGAKHHEDDWNARFHLPMEFLMSE
jgi:predicted alpha/beta superfamily hydrolase